MNDEQKLEAMLLFFSGCSDFVSQIGERIFIILKTHLPWDIAKIIFINGNEEHKFQLNFNAKTYHSFSYSGGFYPGTISNEMMILKLSCLFESNFDSLFRLHIGRLKNSDIENRLNKIKQDMVTRYCLEAFEKINNTYIKSLIKNQ